MLAMPVIRDSYDLTHAFNGASLKSVQKQVQFESFLKLELICSRETNPSTTQINLEFLRVPRVCCSLRWCRYTLILDMDIRIDPVILSLLGVGIAMNRR